MAGRPKRRARLEAAHKAVRTKGSKRCKYCNKAHTESQHWSHAANRGEKSYKHSKKRNARKSPAAKRGRAMSPKPTRGRKAPSRRTVAAGHAAFARAVKKGKTHTVRAHLAENAGRAPGKHRVKKHRQANPGKKKDIRPKRRRRLG